MKTKYTLLLFLFFVFACLTLVAQSVEKTGYPAIDSLIIDMKFTYGITIEVKKPSATSWETSIIDFDPLSKSDYKELSKYVYLFREEFFKYPKEFIEHTHLKKVAFVKHLTNQKVEVAAMPDYYQENLYMDIFVGNYDKTYQRHVVHHEFYHMIEEQLNGNTYFKDPEWAKLNDPSFQYGSGGINARSSDMQPVIHPLDGFISLYAASGLEEDKAELFAGLMTTEEKTKIRNWAETDKILDKKIKYLSAFLKKYSLNLN